MANDPIDVLIVGAGPTGLTLACVLRERGVGIRIVEASAGPQPGSRGKGVQPRSLELLDGLGVADQVVKHGVFGLPVRQYGPSGLVSLDALQAPSPPRPDAPYGASLITPQWRVEEALRERLERLGGKVEFGSALARYAEEADCLRTELTTPDGPTTLRARWLVGCDGGKSLTRGLAGIAFLGETLETHRMLIADVHATAIDREHWHIWRAVDGFFGLCPLPSTNLFQLQASIAPGQDDAVSLENAQRIAARRSGRTELAISDPSWISLWRANIRMVDRYRTGRILLAGDAAHVHSPAGGQGMNTGIQDAFNLGWKLAAVLGGADPALIDTYQEERLPIAAGVLGLSTELMQSAVKAGTMMFRRDEQTMQLGLGYRSSSLTDELRGEGGSLRAGDRAPDAPGLLGANGFCRLFDLLRGPHVTLFGFGTRWVPLLAACRKRFGATIQAYILAADAGDLIDTEGLAHAAYADDSLFVIRPDHYVGLATTADDANVIMAYLERITPAVIP
jgi:2-polyprenyl-6-methoxyphenol hydroxylase-like FAD-dependent oxidoreductase